jgi:ABC-type transport system involved in multi-copper enzyme maturation permease subunit
VVLVLVPLGLFVFEWLVTRIVPSPEQTAWLRAMLAYLPPPVLQATGLGDSMSVTTRGLMGFAYVHPFVILLLGLWTVRVAARGLSGEIGAGTMDLLASRPVARRTIVPRPPAS